MTSPMNLPCDPADLAGLIPRQQARPSNSPNHDKPTSWAIPAPVEPWTGPDTRARGGQHLSLRVVGLVAVALLIWISALGAELPTLPTPPSSSPAGPGIFQVQSVPATTGAGPRSGSKAMTGWLACPPGSLEPFPALLPLPRPPPPVGCRRP